MEGRRWGARESRGLPRGRHRSARRLPLTAVVTTLAALALVAVPATPVRADHYEVNWVAPPVNFSFQGEQTIEFGVSAVIWLTNGHVREWRLELVDDTGAVQGVLCAEDYGIGGDDEVAAELVWDSRFYPGPSEPSGVCDNTTAGSPKLPATPDAFSANGEYKLRVSVKTNATLTTATHEEAFERAVKIDNPPLTPTGVSASFARSDQRVTLRWTANAEPDVFGYAIDECVKTSAQQACASDDWTRVVNPVGRTTTSASVKVDEPGVYRYRVAAKRPHADSTDYFSPAAQTQPIALDADEVEPTTPTTVTGGDDDPDGPGGEGSSGDGTGSDAPSDDGSVTGVSGGRGGGETSRGLPARLIERTEVDAGFDQALPYGAKPLDESGGDDALDIAAKGVGLALVPIAGGLLLFVFAMQMRFLSRRAGALALAGGGPGAGPAARAAEEPDAPVPLFRLGAGGSFISNWKRLLDEPRPRPGD